MLIFVFFAGMLTAFLFVDITKKILILNMFKNSEKQLLFISMLLLEYKYQAINLMKIVYDKAAEEDEKYVEEGKKVIEKIHEKFTYFGDNWITNLKKNLPYETPYNSWNDAVEYFNKLITKDRNNRQS